MNDKFKNYFKGKKVLITGHTGFKGSWLTTWLLNLGSQVIGYSQKPPSNPSMFEILELGKKINHIHGDILDFNHLKNVIE
ncbi:MAG: GDP-mannose 4,6-dehydratase, partial [Methanobacteriaceae archaeon]|nr:GDP-mannose 4,6-dehydratase [Methanobacteriaceae archaeon]